MARVYKIQISKDERRITVNALDIDQYIEQGWMAETEPYIDNPVAIVNTDVSEAQDAVESTEAVVDTSNVDTAIGANSGDESKAAVDEDLLAE